jgi:hypothetical protein
MGNAVGHINCEIIPYLFANLTNPAQQLVIDADSQNGLLINNVATLASAFAPPRQVSLVAKQRRKDTGATTPNFPIDFVLERLEAINAPEDPSKIVVPIKLTIVGFGGHPVKVDTIAIDILQLPGTMQVIRVEKIPFSQTPGAQSCEGQSAWSYCRVKAIVIARILETVKMMREKAHEAKSWAKQCGHRASGRLHQGHHDHHGHNDRHRAHRWARMLHSTLRFFVIPALLGVIGGLIASAIGMLVGQFIVFLWMRTARRGQYSSLRDYDEVVEIVIQDDEKDGFLAEEHDLLPPPPRYEDHAADVEAQEKS